MNLRRTHGFSLIETLIALVVLSIGLLGVAALQVEGLRSGQSALMRTRAVFMAADMAERIKSNREGSLDYVADIAPVAEPAKACADNASGPAPVVDGGCNGTEMAAYDLWLWKTGLDEGVATGLPGGSGAIVIDNTTVPPTHVITINWTERGTARSYSLAIQDDPNG